MNELGLAEKIERIDRGFERARIQHAFGGALALAYYGTPRATVDIDVNVFVGTELYGSVSSTLRRVGVDRIPDESDVARDGQVRMWWDSTPIDVFFSYDEVHEAMRSALRIVPFGDKTIPILAPEHLLVAKVVFNRDKDWIDIEQVLIAVDDLDVKEVRRWLTHLLGKSDARTKRFLRLVSDLSGSN